MVGRGGYKQQGWPSFKMPVLKKQDYWIIQSIKDRETSFEALYEMGKELGRSPTASVFKCQRRGLHQTWSVKVLNKNTDKKIQSADVGILLKLEYKNLIRLKEIFESQSQIFLVQELVTGGELFDRIVNLGTYSEATAAKAINDVVNGLSYLHAHGVVHRNLKPENLLYENLSEDSPLKIADYGLSTMISQEINMVSVCGTPTYTAPEILRGEKYGTAGDMWAVGIILYILLAGVEPFKDDDPQKLFKKIMKGAYEFPSPDWDNISENAQDLVRKLLQLNADRRLTACGACKNCWVVGYTAKRDHIETVVERIKDFNDHRKQKQPELMPVAFTARSRPNSRLTLPSTPMPEIEINIELEEDQQQEQEQ